MLTQEELAERSGLGIRTIRRLESAGIGRARPDSLRLLAQALGLDAAEQAELTAAAHGRTSEDPANPDPADTPAGARPTTRPAVVPRQLPTPVRQFVGRVAELKELDRRFDEDRVAGTGAVVIAIGGGAGVGKTTLALHWAHARADEFVDGQLYVNLRGFDPHREPLAPAEAIVGFLDALAISTPRRPETVEAQAALFRSLAAGRRMLVVLDNARDAEQVRPLLPGAAGCVVLVTSRRPLTGLVVAEGAHPVSLDLFSVAEAEELLTRHLGAERTAPEREAVEEIIERCARLPLALAIVAARAAEQPGFALATFATQLADAGRRLDVLDAGDDLARVRAAFSWSYERVSPTAARLFRLLGRGAGPDIGAPAATSLLGVAPDEAGAALAELTTARLLAEPQPGRYALHDLLRAYAVERLDEVDSAVERDAATRRLLDHYLHTALRAARLLVRLRPALRRDPPPPGTGAEDLDDVAQAMAWYARELPAVLTAVDDAVDAGRADVVIGLAWSMDTYLYRQARWSDMVRVMRMAVVAGDAAGDRLACGYMLRRLGHALGQLGHFDDARSHLDLAIEECRALGDTLEQGICHATYAMLYNSFGAPADALQHYRQALVLYREAGSRSYEANVLNGMGWSHALLGEYEQTLVHCGEALSLQEELGDSTASDQAGTWDSLGYAHHHLGDYPRARECFDRAINLCRRLGGRFHEAVVLDHLGDTHAAQGHIADACEAWRRSTGILRELDHPLADEVDAKLAGTEVVD
jgi:tetratricopeptide (TPR) repeat protein